MSENKDNKLTLINEKTANDYLTHTKNPALLNFSLPFAIMTSAHKDNQKYGGALLHIICNQVMEAFCKIREVRKNGLSAYTYIYSADSF